MGREGEWHSFFVCSNFSSVQTDSVVEQQRSPNSHKVKLKTTVCPEFSSTCSTWLNEVLVDLR